jgi:bacteriocin-like protein
VVQFLANPAAMLRQRGIAVPEGKKIEALEDSEKVFHLVAPAGSDIKVVEQSEDVIHLVIPAQPAEEELSEEELQSVAGGYCGPPCRPCGPPCRP